MEGLLRVLKKNVIKNNIRHEDYKNTLINNKQMYHKLKNNKKPKDISLVAMKIKQSVHSAALMTSATSMIMEWVAMAYGHYKNINHRHQSFYQTYRASILLDKISILFTFAKYRPPYFWTRYQFLLLQNISLHTSGQDIDSLYFCKISASILLDKI